eukprot:1155811-Pelagomonas_calceolata.AAC.2
MLLSGIMRHVLSFLQYATVCAYLDNASKIPPLPENKSSVRMLIGSYMWTKTDLYVPTCADGCAGVRVWGRHTKQPALLDFSCFWFVSCCGMSDFAGRGAPWKLAGWGHPLVRMWARKNGPLSAPHAASCRPQFGTELRPTKMHLTKLERGQLNLVCSFAARSAEVAHANSVTSVMVSGKACPPSKGRNSAAGPVSWSSREWYTDLMLQHYKSVRHFPARTDGPHSSFVGCIVVGRNCGAKLVGILTCMAELESKTYQKEHFWEVQIGQDSEPLRSRTGGGAEGPSGSSQKHRRFCICELQSHAQVWKTEDLRDQSEAGLCLFHFEMSASVKTAKLN